MGSIAAQNRMHKPTKRRRSNQKPKDIKQTVVSSLLENALDYFLSAAEYARKGDLRSLKYCTLHIAASVELLLKAKLFEEHWSLIFADVDKATEAALKSGDFKSADPQTVLDRLETIAKIAVSKEDRVLLDDLRKLRNCIQHFAVTTTEEQASSLVAKTANFLINFCHHELRKLPAQLKTKLKEIKIQLGHFREYVDERLKAIKPDLEEASALTYCPMCKQKTLRLGLGNPNCSFCSFVTEAEELAEAISETPVEECAQCGENSLAFRLMTNEDGYTICLSCGFEEEWHSSCPRCGKLNVSGPICEECAAEEGD